MGRTRRNQKSFHDTEDAAYEAASEADKTTADLIEEVSLKAADAVEGILTQFGESVRTDLAAVRETAARVHETQAEILRAKAEVDQKLAEVTAISKQIQKTKEDIMNANNTNNTSTNASNTNTEGNAMNDSTQAKAAEAETKMEELNEELKEAVDAHTAEFKELKNGRVTRALRRARRFASDYHLAEVVGVAVVAAGCYYGYKHRDTIMAKLGRGTPVPDAAPAPEANLEVPVEAA